MRAISMRGRSIAAIYTNYIMRLDAQTNSVHSGELRSCRIDKDNIGACDKTAFPLRKMKRYLKSRFCEGYLFYNGDDELVGYLWLMRKGANEIQYRIRNIDAFLSFVYEFPEFRGNRICEKMIGDISENAAKNTALYLACRPDNSAALKAYERQGFQAIAKKSFLRILRMNIPYRKL